MKKAIKIEDSSDIKKEVTERWMKAVDYLIEIDVVRSYRKVAEALEMDFQRINLFKNFINDGIKSSYANTEHVVLLKEKFKVSYLYLLEGLGPIIEEKTDSTQKSTSEKILKKDDADSDFKEDNLPEKVEDHEYRIQVLEAEIKMLRRR